MVTLPNKTPQPARNPLFKRIYINVERYESMQEKSQFFQTFFYKGNRIRTVEHNNETWWVATDVCKVLEIVNASMAINGNAKTGDLGLDEDEKGILSLYTPGGPQATLCVNEPGLYHLISKSHTPEAKTFGRWVRHEVLPAIRKTGSYSLPQQEPQKQQHSWQETDWRVSLLALSKDELIRELQRTMSVAIETVYNYRYPMLALSKDASICDLHYLRTILAALESIYNNKYSQGHNKYPQEEHGPHPTETFVLPPVEAKPDLQTALLDYLRKAGTVTVRQIQQSGPRSLRNLSADQLRAMLQVLVENGIVKIVPVGKTEGYQLL
jgi:prophage antirepressor-like protein